MNEDISGGAAAENSADKRNGEGSKKPFARGKLSGIPPKKVLGEKKELVKYIKIKEGVRDDKTHAHWGWITKIKYYEDLYCILSSSLDGFIHMHEIETLEYRPRKTFNLHQKGINCFVYSTKHRFVASCGEERHIILWEPYCLGYLCYLIGHNTSISHLDINEERNHLISLGTDKVVKIWDTRHYVCI